MSKTVLNDLDIWSEVGANALLKKTIKTKITGGKIVISFPQTKVGQAVISAIAIATESNRMAVMLPLSMVENNSCKNCKWQSWLDIGDKQYANNNIRFNSLPSNLYGADWLQPDSTGERKTLRYQARELSDLFFAVRQGWKDKEFLQGFENTNTYIITDENGGTTYNVFRKRFLKGDSVSHHIPIRIVIVCRQPVTSMQPAFDLKPVTSYRTNVAIPGKGVNKEQFAGRECCRCENK